MPRRAGMCCGFLARTAAVLDDRRSLSLTMSIKFIS